MNYIIHNKNIIGNHEQQVMFDQAVARKVKHIERVLSNYKKQVLLEIYISRPSSHQYKISLSLKLRSKLLYLEDTQDHLQPMTNRLLDTLRNRVKGQIIKERKEYFYKRKQRRIETFAEYAAHLDNYYEQREKEQFNHLAKNLLPELQTYVLRYLKIKGSDIKSNLTIQEIQDDVYVHLFDRFSKRPENSEELTSWIFRVVREYLDQYIDQQDHKEETLDIQSLAAEELKELEEEFTVDAEGEIILMEDLDDISYKSRRYGPEIFAEEALIDMPEEHSLSEEIKFALSTFDDMEQLVFDMHWLDELNVSEIGRALNLEEQEVMEMIKNTTKKIEDYLKKNTDT